VFYLIWKLVQVIWYHVALIHKLLSRRRGVKQAHIYNGQLIWNHVVYSTVWFLNLMTLNYPKRSLTSIQSIVLTVLIFLNAIAWKIQHLFANTTAYWQILDYKLFKCCNQRELLKVTGSQSHAIKSAKNQLMTSKGHLSYWKPTKGQLSGILHSVFSHNFISLPL